MICLLMKRCFTITSLYSLGILDVNGKCSFAVFSAGFRFLHHFLGLPFRQKTPGFAGSFHDTHFFYKNTQVLPSLDIPKFFFGFEPCIILELFLNIEGVTVSETQRIIFKSLLVSYFIIKPNQIGTK